MLRRSSILWVALWLSGCSPFFVMRAGYEEASILARRQPIEKLLQSPDVDATLKEKFVLVQQAREFAKAIGLKPEGSFTEYSQIDRDVLVWVLSAAPDNSFEPYTWWFPFVGSVPYHGYFTEEDGKNAAKHLAKRSYDVFLRPSPAYSTLGWFDDPLLSTYIHYSDVDLANTVIHELTHNTVWFPDYVEFNETLAHVIGSLGAAHFFRCFRHDEQSAQEAEAQFFDDLVFSDFLATTRTTLEDFYRSSGNGHSKEQRVEFLKRRQEVFQQALAAWKMHTAELQSERYHRADLPLNNASIIAWQLYLRKPQTILALYQACDGSLEKFVAELKDINENLRRHRGAAKLDPYEAVALRTKELREGGTNGNDS